MEVNGYADADRLVVEDVFGTRLVPVRGGIVQAAGIESLTFWISTMASACSSRCRSLAFS